MSETENTQPASVSEPPSTSMVNFLQAVPPSTQMRITDAVKWLNTKYLSIPFPRITLHCGSVQCGGTREFDSQTMLSGEQQSHFTFIHYVCRNCERTSKTYAVHFSVVGKTNAADAIKFGEHPHFGPPTPARVTTLVGSARDYYFKGTRSENQGLGIAAFAYYRRVVEDRKANIFSEIKRVAEKLGGSAELFEELEAASKEQQFSKAVEIVKHGLPASLLINGHNPLTLLHSALSEGLHAQTDAECLEVATSIRVVLADFVERVGNALKDEAALTAAVSRLMQKRTSTDG